MITGHPDRTKISTSYVERSNLTLRMHCRRFTRLTNAFSKTLRNHRAAFALHVAFYNLVRVHETPRVTQAVALGVTDHVWTARLALGRGTRHRCGTDAAPPPPLPPPPAPVPAPTGSAPRVQPAPPRLVVLRGGRG